METRALGQNWDLSQASCCREMMWCRQLLALDWRGDLGPKGDVVMGSADVGGGIAGIDMEDVGVKQKRWMNGWSRQ